MSSEAGAEQPERWRIEVRGIVQGVGFRPFVYGLALRLGLAGFVRNDSDGVTIEAEGAPAVLTAFVVALRHEAPPLARVESVQHQAIALHGDADFVIAHSAASAHATTLIAPDSATCADCLQELFDPADRRYRYPFINCTNCGPRLTIVAAVPYDRPNTTMAVFPMCAQCQAEYDDPLNRRFHAQPNACPMCGPQLQIVDCRMQNMEQSTICNLQSAITTVAQALRDGAIVALKGLGGYHLACDATNQGAVARLRQRKRREFKPFALMVPDLATARRLCHVSEAEAALLESPRRPIVLLERQHFTAEHAEHFKENKTEESSASSASSAVSNAVAPGHTALGLMLPYTPLHHVLLRDFAATGEPGQPAVLVMTSGNLSDEPIAYRDDEARTRLADIADLFLSHNREILTRCDDSVARINAGGEQLLRRSRGYAPEPMHVKLSFPHPILACGGHLKNSFCLARGQHAFLSHHIGDLENLETLTSFREGIAHYQRLFDITPEVIAYDLHPEYLATKEALASPIPLKIGVQHHHAHIASVMVEHGLTGEVIGIAADGTGYGTDGAIWGGEVLVASLSSFERAGQLAYVPLPGGDAAARQPWRMAAAYLHAVYGSQFLDLDLPFARSIDRGAWAVLQQMIMRGFNSPLTSSMGRLFDAVAALVGLRGVAHYEGQAAIELEALAERGAEVYPFAITPGAPFQLDMRPTLAAIVADVQRSVAVSHIAGRFHSTVAAMLLNACQHVRASHGLHVVALSGGVFQNQLLLETLHERLTGDGFIVYTNRRVPPNDGGLSLGQAAVAAAKMAE
ncbi:MAG: carbamoyltransferase HypF [Chloroflexaceae bacterium]|nr:carbamoyltransferase HypF [Chloroflexaceae bacterium]